MAIRLDAQDYTMNASKVTNYNESCVKNVHSSLIAPGVIDYIDSMRLKLLSSQITCKKHAR